jgi:RimJ/RimL family protein N-acetyltransferase
MDLDVAGLLEPVEISAGRYRLRPPRPSEAEDLLAMLHDPVTRMWNPNHRGDVEDVDEARAWCEKWADWNGGRVARFSVVDPAEGRLLGTVTLRDVNRLTLAAGLGYNTAPWARGRGVATSALRAVADWAFGPLGLVRLELCHAVGNPASCGVARKSGFRIEGELRQSYRYGDGELHDEHLHARLASDPA